VRLQAGTALRSNVGWIACHRSVSRPIDLAEAVLARIEERHWHQAVGTLGDPQVWEASAANSGAEREQMPEHLDLGDNRRERVEIVAV
jgi:hypothetical protein